MNHGIEETPNDLCRRRQDTCRMGYRDRFRQRLAEIEREFNEKVAQGWFAADISEKRDVLIREFDPNAEILLIPRVQGGR